jgi:hypothetical protein
VANGGIKPIDGCCLAARPESRHYPHELGAHRRNLQGVSPTPEALILRYRRIARKWSPGMKAARLFIGVVAVVSSIQMAAAQEIDPRMPEGPNREFVSKVCSECHALSNLYSTVGRTREGWNRVLEDMVRYGLKATPEERTRILDYLSAAMGP